MKKSTCKSGSKSPKSTGKMPPWLDKKSSPKKPKK